MKKPPYLKFEEMLPLLRSLLTMGLGAIEDTLNIAHLKNPDEQELRSHLVSKFIEMRMGPEMPSQDALVEAILSYGVQLESHPAKEIAKALAEGERISAFRDSSNSENSDVMMGSPSECESDLLYHFGLNELPDEWDIEDITEDLIEEGWANEDEESEKSKAIEYVERYIPKYRHDAGHPAQFFGNTLYVPSLPEDAVITEREPLLAMTFEGTGYSYSNWIMKRKDMESILTDHLGAMPRFFSQDGKMYFDDAFIYPPLFQNDVYDYKNGSRAFETLCHRYSVSSSLFPAALKQALLDYIIDHRYDEIYYLPAQSHTKSLEAQRLYQFEFLQAPVGLEEIEEVYTKLGKEICAGLRLFEINWFGYSREPANRYDEENRVRILLFCYPEERPTTLLGRGERIDIASRITLRGKEFLTFVSNHLFGGNAPLESFDHEVFHFMNGLEVFDFTEKVFRFVLGDLPFSAASDLESLRELIILRESNDEIIPANMIPTFSPLPPNSLWGEYEPISSDGEKVLLRKRQRTTAWSYYSLSREYKIVKL